VKPSCDGCDVDHLPEWHMITHVIIDGVAWPGRLLRSTADSVTLELERGDTVTVPLDDYRPHHVEGA
jgi:hypothetical protein